MILHKFFAWFGCALLAIGLALLSPLADFLPVELVPYLNGNFTHTNGHMYLRVVPDSFPNLLAIGLVSGGALVVVVAWLLGRSSKSR